MLLDAHGRALRRTIGYLPELRPVPVQRTAPVDLVGYPIELEDELEDEDEEKDD